MGRCCRANFFRRLRILARRSIGFEKRVAELGPAYANCGPRPSKFTCTRPKADPRNGCPKCEYQIQRKHFLADVEREFKQGSPGPEADEKWPVPVMEDFLNAVSRANYEYPRRPNPRWPLTLSYGVEIYRAEVSKSRAADSWQLRKDMEARNEQRGRGYKVPPSRAKDDDDVYDGD